MTERNLLLSRSSKLIEPKILDTSKGECNLISIAIGQEEPRTPDDCLCRINVLGSDPGHAKLASGVQTVDARYSEIAEAWSPG
jgi:hypothetical protein